MGLSCSKFLKTTSKKRKKLPLLRLPFFALLEIFKSLDPIELFILSLCSRKVANCIHIVGSNKWKLSVDVGKKRIEINDTYKITIIESSKKPSWKYDTNSKKFSLEYKHRKDRKLELQKVLAQLQFAFKCPVTSFKYDDKMESDQCWISVLDYIIQNQSQRLDSFDLRGTFDKEELEWALQNMKTSRKIKIHLHGTLEFTSHFRPECEQFTFESPNLLHLDLMTFKSCKYMDLSVSLTIHELDVFMEEWKIGGFPNLKYMKTGKICFDLPEINTIIGIEISEMLIMRGRPDLRIDENLWVECYGGADVQLDNGTKATMDLYPGKSFELFVWNN